MTRIKPAAFVAIAGSILLASGAHASPVTMQYTSTVSSISGNAVAGVSAGGAAKFSVVLDNGGSSLASQTWTAANILSVTMDFGNGALSTTFSAPFDGGLWQAGGTYTTDSLGAITSVMLLADVVVDANFVSSGSSTSFSWFINGANIVYSQQSPGNVTSININNVLGNIAPRNWTMFANQVPEPGSLALAGLGLVGLRVSRRRAR